MYVHCRGYLRTERRIIQLPPDATVKEAREKFGRPVRQQLVLDENQYTLDPNIPIWQFSNKCNISLILDYAGADEFDSAKNYAGQMFKATGATVSDKLGSAKNHVGKILKTTTDTDNSSQSEGKTTGSSPKHD